ncbi:TetR family transcriptional regulator [Alicyclobacillus sacchari]|uniref:TetR family transcriptional regulator n=1 Tax=Alicyclobacillus sacchari TaxID=392010 RepID=A0A4R8LUX9_9BACL|nr:TetR/AcrR family transcriptional regulator [Alicyclobacillus sacchari]TDY50625.1 TetR family transcriptional regulator [Alicyclobacillus sacchari]GMA55586.1 fatty acid metabolism regulator protein [Alicyclobacillus sacchari]GMA59190.1 fatty acid metabolism regulator protein [Alicyclobacillus sacchari]
MTSGLAEKKREKYDAILSAALKIFAEYGYFGSQVSKIAREAGVADGTIYLYFKSKEDILVSLFREKLGNLVRMFHEHIHEDDRADDAIRKICELHFTELEKNVDLAKVTQLELRQSSLDLHREISNALKPYIQLIEDVLVRGIEQGVFRPDLDVKLTRLLLFGAMDEVVSSWLISGRRYSLSDQVEKTVDFFLRGLRA